MQALSLRSVYDCTGERADTLLQAGLLLSFRYCRSRLIDTLASQYATKTSFRVVLILLHLGAAEQGRAWGQEVYSRSSLGHQAQKRGRAFQQSQWRDHRARMQACSGASNADSLAHSRRQRWHWPSSFIAAPRRMQQPSPLPHACLPAQLRWR